MAREVPNSAEWMFRNWADSRFSESESASITNAAISEEVKRLIARTSSGQIDSSVPHGFLAQAALLMAREQKSTKPVFTLYGRHYFDSAVTRGERGPELGNGFTGVMAQIVSETDDPQQVEVLIGETVIFLSRMHQVPELTHKYLIFLRDVKNLGKGDLAKAYARDLYQEGRDVVDANSNLREVYDEIVPPIEDINVQEVLKSCVDDYRQRVAKGEKVELGFGIFQDAFIELMNRSRSGDIDTQVPIDFFKGVFYFFADQEEDTDENFLYALGLYDSEFYNLKVGEGRVLGEGFPEIMGGYIHGSESDLKEGIRRAAEIIIKRRAASPQQLEEHLEVLNGIAESGLTIRNIRVVEMKFPGSDDEPPSPNLRIVK